MMSRFWYIAVAIATIPCPALARPRDDAMSGAYRCAAIPDSRMWLACYYGAAQPVRAALGLPPAPASQIDLASHPPQGNAPAQDDTVRDEAMTVAAGCTSHHNDRDWLQCYYDAAEPIRAQLSLGATPVRPAPTDFGFRPKIVERESDEVAAPVRQYSFDMRGWFTVTLDNGQVWRQVPGDTLLAKWKKPAGIYFATITRGFFGSYNLQLRGLSGIYKVERVR